jgi:hypothetical protein
MVREEGRRDEEEEVMDRELEFEARREREGMLREVEDAGRV